MSTIKISKFKSHQASYLTNLILEFFVVNLIVNFRYTEEVYARQTIFPLIVT